MVYVCAKLQLPSLFRIGLKVYGGVLVDQVTTTSNLNLSCIELELGLGFDNIRFGVRRSILVTPI